MAQIKIYGKPDRGGDGHLELRSSVPDLTKIHGHGFDGFGNWNDEMRSFEIFSGKWQFYLNANYDTLVGRTPERPDGIFGPGYYSNVENPDVAISRDSVSSIKLISE